MHAALLLFSALPSALAAHLYSVSDSLAATEADDSNDCVLPDSYRILNFKATSEEGGSLDSYSFTYKDADTGITTPCEFNSTSEAAPSNGNTPRYPCDNSDVVFIWKEEYSRITLIEYLCPDTNGSAQYEVEGSAIINLNCPEAGGSCYTNSTDQTAVFSSLNPVQSS